MRINRLKTTEYTITSGKIGSAFDGYTFAYLADLHDVCVGKNNSLVKESVKEHSPRAILLGGDMITQRKAGAHRTDWRNAAGLILALAETAPVYYSIGNHERRWQEYQHDGPGSFADFRKTLETEGIRFLDNRSVRLHAGNGELIRISGLSLPMQYFGRGHRNADAQLISKCIGAPDRDHFQILLAHSPTHHEAYDGWGADLTLSGHYHGGQIRLPFIGGLISTGWTVFPKYDMGSYELANSRMIVSSGLGTHTIPLRINNPPEAVYITLRKA